MIRKARWGGKGFSFFGRGGIRSFLSYLLGKFRTWDDGGKRLFLALSEAARMLLNRLSGRGALERRSSRVSRAPPFQSLETMKGGV